MQTKLLLHNSMFYVTLALGRVNTENLPNLCLMHALKILENFWIILYLKVDCLLRSRVIDLNFYKKRFYLYVDRGFNTSGLFTEG